MELTLTKTRKYDLKPFGKFTIKWMKNKPRSEKTIPVQEVSIDWNDTMPFTEQQEKDIIKEMKKNKTDVFEENGNYYTRLGGGNFGSLTKISHPKFYKYYNNIGGFKDYIDSL